MRDRFVLVLTAVLLGSGLMVVGATPAAASTITLNPVADSYVQSDLPTSNFGTATSVKVDGSPVTTSYLKFDVQALAAAPGKATLRVFKAVHNDRHHAAAGRRHDLERIRYQLRQQAGARWHADHSARPLGNRRLAHV